MAASERQIKQRTGASRTKRLAPWAVLAWLALWQLGSMALGSTLLLPGPLAVLARLAELVPDPSFWRRVAFSLVRIAGGFALGAGFAALGAIIAVRWRRVEEFLAPLMALAKSVPVASITVLALIWLRAANLAVLVVALVAAPVVYENLLAGLRAAAPALDETARLFSIPPARRLRFFRMPQLYPTVESALSLALGMSWKAGVAAEVIGIPSGSLGQAIYDAKVTFDTAGLFAVTLAVVLASVTCTWVLRGVLRAIEPWACGAAGHAGAYETAADASAHPGDTAGEASAAELSLHAERLTKRFGERTLFEDLSFEARPDEPICLMAPSGFGKTTLLRIAAGLEQADDGALVINGGAAAAGSGGPRVSMVFQDDRLAEGASALANVRLPLARGSAAWNEAPALLAELDLSDELLSPARTCSGGQRRRISIARALLAPHDVLLLDEPFTGLDDATKEQVAHAIRRRETGRIVLLATHDTRDAALLNARILQL